MIKNFLDADEDDSLITKRPGGEKPADKNEFDEFAAPFAKIEDEADLLEIPELRADPPNISEHQKAVDELIDSQTPIGTSNDESSNQTAVTPSLEPETESADYQSPAAEKKETKNDGYEIFSQSPYQSESSDETIRKSGLAYAAAIILFGSIVFTLILGWFADLLFGTSPWGKVGGIILGSIIGFVQFFRTTSQLLKNKD